MVCFSEVPICEQRGGIGIRVGEIEVNDVAAKVQIGMMEFCTCLANSDEFDLRTVIKGINGEKIKTGRPSSDPFGGADGSRAAAAALRSGRFSFPACRNDSKLAYFINTIRCTAAAPAPVVRRTR